MRETFPWESAPRYLLLDRDCIFGREFVDQVKAMGHQTSAFSAAVTMAACYVRTGDRHQAASGLIT
jgi:hypothetical protein